MKLSTKESQKYYEILSKLLYAVNEKRHVVLEFDISDIMAIDLEKSAKIREELWSNTECLKDIIAEGEVHGFTAEELEILGEWHDYHIYSEFIIAEHRANHTVFMDIKNEERLYAVVGLLDPLKKVVPPRFMPGLAVTVLLPFKGKIIYDGILGMVDTSEDPLPREDFNKSYREAKRKWGTSFKLGG